MKHMTLSEKLNANLKPLSHADALTRLVRAKEAAVLADDRAKAALEAALEKNPRLLERLEALAQGLIAAGGKLDRPFFPWLRVGPKELSLLPIEECAWPQYECALHLARRLLDHDGGLFPPVRHLRDLLFEEVERCRGVAFALYRAVHEQDQAWAEVAAAERELEEARRWKEVRRLAAAAAGTWLATAVAEVGVVLGPEPRIGGSSGGPVAGSPVPGVLLIVAVALSAAAVLRRVWPGRVSSARPPLPAV